MFEEDTRSLWLIGTGYVLAGLGMATAITAQSEWQNLLALAVSVSGAAFGAVGLASRLSYEKRSSHSDNQ